MNILEVLSVQIPCTPYGQFYEVPLKDILLSHQMLEQGCPVPDETECPPLFQTRLVSRDVLSDFVEAWSRLEASALQDDGVIVLRDSSEAAQPRRLGAVVGRTPQREQKLSQGDGTAGDVRVLPDIVPRRNANTTAEARDRGLDETLSDTFPCSDALSSIPDPPVSGIVWQ
ncbi:MAG TPA: hypothetical protein VII95_04025 [Terriglobales bacterium]|jgi:hypothetical protein